MHASPDWIYFEGFLHSLNMSKTCILKWVERYSKWWFYQRCSRFDATYEVNFQVKRSGSIFRPGWSGVRLPFTPPRELLPNWWNPKWNAWLPIEIRNLIFSIMRWLQILWNGLLPEIISRHARLGNAIASRTTIRFATGLTRRHTLAENNARCALRRGCSVSNIEAPKTHWTLQVRWLSASCHTQLASP